MPPADKHPGGQRGPPWKLTLHEQSQEAAVVVRKLVLEETGPVVAQDCKGHHNVVLGFKATGLKRQVDGLQEPEPLRQWGPGGLQPFWEVKLEGEEGQNLNNGAG